MNVGKSEAGEERLGRLAEGEREMNFIQSRKKRQI